LKAEPNGNNPRQPTTQSATQKPISKTEFSKAIDNVKQDSKADNKTIFAIENQKGSGSILEETGLKLNFPGLLKETTKTLGGIFSLFKEILMDTVTMVVGKKEKKAEKVDSDPVKARAAAEKKAENKRKNINIRSFFESVKSQAPQAASAEAVQFDVQEKENINKTAKIGNEAYKGIKNSFGRLTVYASSMFERAQMDQEKQMKKVEKEQKMASVGKPDLNLDKAAEGGFLSSTGGQGAG